MSGGVNVIVLVLETALHYFYPYCRIYGCLVSRNVNEHRVTTRSVVLPVARTWCNTETEAKSKNRNATRGTNQRTHIKINDASTLHQTSSRVSNRIIIIPQTQRVKLYIHNPHFYSIKITTTENTLHKSRAVEL